MNLESIDTKFSLSIFCFICLLISSDCRDEGGGGGQYGDDQQQRERGQRVLRGAVVSPRRGQALHARRVRGRGMYTLI